MAQNLYYHSFLTYSMKGYLIFKEWITRIIVASALIVLILIFMFIEGMKKIPLLLYVMSISALSVFILISLFMVFLNMQNFLSKIYLFDEHFEIKYKRKILKVVNLSDIESVKIVKDGIFSYFVIEVIDNKESSNISVQYNKNIYSFFEKNGFLISNK